VTDPTPASSRDSAKLQFDRAEPGTSATTASSCVVCKKPLTTTYFEVNGKTVCPDCRTRLEAHLNAGTPAGRFLKALGLGAGAAVLGAGIYYGIAAVTGAEWGIVAIVVGFLVGKAVRKGSNGRGGWRYQALAMALTYCSLVAAYAPFIFKAMGEQADHRASQVADRSRSAATIAPRAADTAAIATSKATTVTSDSEPRTPSAGTVLAAVALLAGLIFAAPILSAVDSPIGFILIGIALYEAWKFNRGVAYKITGPYRVAAPNAGTA